MATKTIEARTADVCDFCSAEGYIRKCWVCGRDCCLTCMGIVACSWGFTDLCRECVHRADVKKVCDKYADELTPIFHRRNKALKRLGKKLRAEQEAEEE